MAQSTVVRHSKRNNWSGTITREAGQLSNEDSDDADVYAPGSMGKTSILGSGHESCIVVYRGCTSM
jgi:hypothetical protein